MIGLLGPRTLPQVTAHLQNPTYTDETRTAASTAIKYIGEFYPETRDTVITVLSKQLAKYHKQSEELNAFLISDLTDLEAVETASIMEAAFKSNKVELSILGDWEEVQIRLGLLSERITPPPRYGWVAPHLNPRYQLDLLRGEIEEEEDIPQPDLAIEKKKQVARKRNLANQRKKKRRRKRR